MPQKQGVPATPSGHSPKGGAAKASPAKPSVPNAWPSKEWCLRMAKLESELPDGCEIGAGVPDDMLLEAVFKKLRALVWAARTSGGTAGPDKFLMEACEDAEQLIERFGRGYGLTPASADRSPNGQDREDGLDAKHESAVGASRDAQKAPPND